jgi:hypothetical protein
MTPAVKKKPAAKGSIWAGLDSRKHFKTIGQPLST